VSDVDFYKAIATFRGATGRQQVLHTTDSSSVILDFAHAPSKVRATVSAFKEYYPGRKLIVCLELHTYSSLDKKFISEYKNTLAPSDEAAIFYNPETVKHKHLENISDDEIRKAFGSDKLTILTDIASLEEWIKKFDYRDSNLLLMSSGNFGGLNLSYLAKNLTV
jgi:UDP-N-acetylmuramate: L-alanyl-gamma-D-glutamyl-meso-diaminopimelate ligase